MVAIVLSPPFHGLLGVSQCFEDALSGSSDEDFGCDAVVVGTESFPTYTQGFRPGLYSGAALRLGITIRFQLWFGV